jgi:phosphoglycolate phosphatase
VIESTSRTREGSGTVNDHPSLIVFDLDGTLADSQAGVLHSFTLTLADFGQSASAETLRDLIGPPLSVSFARLGFVGDDVDVAVTRYRTYYDRDGVDMSLLYDGIAEMLGALRDRGVELAVATSKRVDFARRMLRNLGIEDFFPVICGAALDGTLNTKREVLEEALRLVRPRPPGEVWMVGDRSEDVRAAIFHSVVSVGALWGYGARAELEDGGATILVADPSDLLRVLYLNQ